MLGAYCYSRYGNLTINYSIKEFTGIYPASRHSSDRLVNTLYKYMYGGLDT